MACSFFCFDLQGGSADRLQAESRPSAASKTLLVVFLQRIVFSFLLFLFRKKFFKPLFRFLTPASIPS
jgi:hypothetical protein